MAVIHEANPLGPAPADTVRGHPRWYAHRLNRPTAYRLAAVVGAGLPRGLRLRLAAAIGPRLRALFVTEWRVVLGNVARIAPTASPEARHALALEVFRHFAMCFSDLVVTNRRRDGRRVLGRLHGHAHFEATAHTGRGLIVLTAHLGNWELGGRLVAETIARPTHVGDMPVPFFGAPAHFLRCPFVLARATGAPILPAFCVLDVDRRYSVYLHEPVVVGTDGESAALERWVAVLEDMVRAHPEQWFNFFDCWNLPRDA